MDDLERTIRAASVGGKLPCAQAFSVAREQGEEPAKIGEEATRLGIRISRCQLGLFGYNEQGRKRILQPAATVAKSLREAIQARLVEGQLPCRAAWKIAQEGDLPKLQVANAVEALNLRISACQLGCFS